MYNDSLDFIEPLSIEQRGSLFTAIMCYVNNRTLPEMDDFTKMAFIVIRGQIDRDTEKYQQMTQSKSAAGKKGAEKRWGDKSVSGD